MSSNFSHVASGDTEVRLFISARKQGEGDKVIHSIDLEAVDEFGSSLCTHQAQKPLRIIIGGRYRNDGGHVETTPAVLLAAPDMLAALRALSAVRPSNADEGPEIAAALALCDAAIAKAEAAP